MLVELSIRNLAVIEYIQLQFNRGFQVLTGETGAGKSMIIDALSLIVGGRASIEWVRHGTNKAEIEAAFELYEKHPIWVELDKLGIRHDPNEQLIIRREININGKSSARVNGQLVNLTMLKGIGEWLVNLHGQHEHQALLKTEQHLLWLDLYGGKPLSEAIHQYRQTYARFTEIQSELNKLQATGQQNLRMQDMYRFQVDEINKAALIPEEEASLTKEKQLLSHAEKLFHSMSNSYDSLNGSKSGMESISNAIQQLEQVVEYDVLHLKPILEQIQSSFYQLEDAAMQLRHYRDEIAEFNPERLSELEQRLDLIHNLKRKYGSSISEILNYLAQIENELDLIDNKEERIADLQDKLEMQKQILADQASELTKIRKKTASKLAKEVEKELQDLQMEKTRFEVKLEPSDGFNKSGHDAIEFMISPNPGEPLRSLGKIASGGELSRIMLALKTVFANMDYIPVLIFDEVDTGVSGRAAQAIANKLSALSSAFQIFSITHLAQVACMADSHYEINKITKNNKTYTQVKLLTNEHRILEIARMLGGVEVTKTTEHHAKEMLDMAAYNKEKRKHLQ